MLKRFYINNFKSLVDFEIDFSTFNCLIGLNGSGKSTLLQAIDFVSSLMTGNVNDWVKKRGWGREDIASKMLTRHDIEISVDIEINGIDYRWSAMVNDRDGLFRCSEESIKRLSDGILVFNLTNEKYILPDNAEEYPINFTYEGSVLSQLKIDLLGEIIPTLINTIILIRSMDLLSPQLLRKRARKTEESDIGMGGEHLSAFIHELDNRQKQLLRKQIQQYYPQLHSIKTKRLKSGWIQFWITEKYENNQGEIINFETEARHINDGMLRLLAILALQFSESETLLFDEIENGINPEITEKLVDALVDSPKQIIVTTHSPMVLNYLDDEVARKSVIFLYKRPDGITRAVRFFEIPSAAEKLRCLAAGDAMLDLFLADMALEAEQMRQTLNA
jgi:predicted ATPase